MLKKVSFVVWSAFIVWMVFFLFSISQANASAPESRASKLMQALPTETQPVPMATQLKNYSDFLCDQFTASQYCRDFAYHIIDNPAQKVPLNQDDPKAYVLYLTLKVCSSANSVTGEMSAQRSKCFKLADMHLAEENFGNHPECRTKPTFIWNEKESDLKKEVNCYKSAFAKDLEEAKQGLRVQDPSKQVTSDHAVNDFKKDAKGLCHKIENFEPSFAFKTMPTEFRGLILIPQGSCQKLVVKWAEGLKMTDFSAPTSRDDLKKKFLQYSMLNFVCMDPVKSQKPKFIEKCFYSGGMENKGSVNAIRYLDCLTPDLISDSDEAEEVAIQKTAADDNVAKGIDRNSRQCYIDTFKKDFDKVKEMWQVEVDDDNDIQAPTSKTTIEK